MTLRRSVTFTVCSLLFAMAYLLGVRRCGA
jgi:hypothetical protein